MFLFCNFGESGSFLEKANMMVLSKEATEKKISLETHLMVTTKNPDERLSGEAV